MSSKNRVKLAFSLAPLATPLVLWIGELILDYPGRVPSGLSGSLLVNLMFSLPIAYAAELVFGFPAWKAFGKFSISSPFAFAAFGGLIGLLPAVFLAGDKIRAGGLCMVAGAASALLFRLLIATREATQA